MLSSRGFLLGRSIKGLLKKTPINLNGFQRIRNSHVVNYRVAPPPHSTATRVGAELVGALMWWWILWHLWHEHEHITGEFAYPEPRDWTNAELGIPPDDE